MKGEMGDLLKCFCCLYNSLFVSWSWFVLLVYWFAWFANGLRFIGLLVW